MFYPTIPQRLQYRDSNEKGKGERGEALRRGRSPWGAEQDPHCAWALCPSLLQGSQRCLLEWVQCHFKTLDLFVLDLLSSFQLCFPQIHKPQNNPSLYSSWHLSLPLYRGHTILTGVHCSRRGADLLKDQQEHIQAPGGWGRKLSFSVSSSHTNTLRR